MSRSKEEEDGKGKVGEGKERGGKGREGKGPFSPYLDVLKIR
jgi:hypothetical protein